MRFAFLVFFFASAAPAHALEARLAPALRAELLEDAGGGGSLTPGPEVAVPVALTIIPGFGLGHYWIGDNRAGFVFLIVDAVFWVGAIVVGGVFRGVINIPGAILGAVWIAIRVWAILDLLGFKVGDITGQAPPRGPPPAWAEIFSPAAGSSAPPGDPGTGTGAPFGGPGDPRFRPAVAR